MSRLLNSRMVPPKLPQNILIRKNLSQKIALGLEKKVMVLEAGAGHGKTLALRQAIAVLPEESWCWLNLAEDCNHLTIFWSYFLETVSPLLKDNKEVAYDYFNRSIREGTLKDFGLFLLKLLPNESYYLIFDDFHFINQEELIISIDRFINELPKSLHIILITRYKPRVYLGNVLIENELFYITENDFLLSNQEANDFIRLSDFDFLDDEYKKRLINKAQGWLGGLQLLLLSKSYQNNGLNIISEKNILYDYLVHEIINNLPDFEKNFLVQTAYYPFVFPELSHHLFPDISHHDILTRLLKQNIMLTCLDGKEERFVYHPLIRETLIEEFLKLPHYAINNMVKSACEIFSYNGYFDEAFSILLSLNDYQSIMNLITNHPQNLRTTFYIEKVPDSVVVLNVDFAFQKIFYYYTLMNYEKIESLVLALENQYPNLKNAWVFEGLRLFVGLEYTKIKAPIQSYQQVISLPLNNVSKALLLLKNSIILYYNNSYRQAIICVEQSNNLNSVFRDPFIIYFNQTFLAQVYEEIGDFKESLSLLKQTYLKIEDLCLDKNSNADYYSNFNLTIAGIHLKKMDLSLAEIALSKVSKQADSHMEASYLFNYAELLYLKNQPDDALKIVEKLNMSEYYQNIRMKSSIYRYMLKNNQLSKSERIIILNEMTADDNYSITNLLFVAMIYLEHGELEKALKYANKSLEISRKEAIFLRIISAGLLKIDILLSMEAIEKRQLVDLYYEVIYYARINQILSEFVLYQFMLRAFFSQYNDLICANLSQVEIEFHNKIKELIDYKDFNVLTAREIEVLLEISKGFTNKEISENLFISTATVKTHLLNIYRKLDVNSRLMAVDEARRLKILIE